jgi:hypothetical protein
MKHPAVRPTRRQLPFVAAGYTGATAPKCRVHHPLSRRHVPGHQPDTSHAHSRHGVTGRGLAGDAERRGEPRSECIPPTAPPRTRPGPQRRRQMRAHPRATMPQEGGGAALRDASCAVAHRRALARLRQQASPCTQSVWRGKGGGGRGGGKTHRTMCPRKALRENDGWQVGAGHHEARRHGRPQARPCMRSGRFARLGAGGKTGGWARPEEAPVSTTSQQQ